MNETGPPDAEGAMTGDGAHLDPLALDAVRAGEADAAAQGHAAACPVCRARVATLTALAADLTAAHDNVADAATDRAVAAAADRLLPRAARVRRLRPRWIAAAAAAVLFGAIVLFGGRGDAPPPPPLRGDVDGDGRVDIVDAYVLATRLRDGRATDAAAADLDGDGAVDARDVDAIARAAVRLEGR